MLLNNSMLKSGEISQYNKGFTKVHCNIVNCHVYKFYGYSR